MFLWPGSGPDLCLFMFFLFIYVFHVFYVFYGFHGFGMVRASRFMFSCVYLCFFMFLWPGPGPDLCLFMFYVYLCFFMFLMVFHGFVWPRPPNLYVFMFFFVFLCFFFGQGPDLGQGRTLTQPMKPQGINQKFVLKLVFKIIASNIDKPCHWPGPAHLAWPGLQASRPPGLQGSRPPGLQASRPPGLQLKIC